MIHKYSHPLLTSLVTPLADFCVLTVRHGRLFPNLGGPATPKEGLIRTRTGQMVCMLRVTNGMRQGEKRLYTKGPLPPAGNRRVGCVCKVHEVSMQINGP